MNNTNNKLKVTIEDGTTVDVNVLDTLSVKTYNP